MTLNERGRTSKFTSKTMLVEQISQGFDTEVRQCLNKVDKISFNIFKLQIQSGNNALSIITPFILALYDSFKIENIHEAKFANFIKAIQGGYRSDLPYHNSAHAADVVQMFHYFIKTCKAREFSNLSSGDISACVISAAIHDYQHPGLNNSFLINSADTLAILYNDRSVLENHHVASSFKLLNKQENNFFIDMPPEAIRQYRTLMIQLVLATDFSKHFKDLGKFKLIYCDSKVEPQKNVMLKMLMHAADISNSTRK